MMPVLVFNSRRVSDMEYAIHRVRCNAGSTYLLGGYAFAIQYEQPILVLGNTSVIAPKLDRSKKR